MTSRTTRALYRLAVLTTTITLIPNLAPPNALAQNGDSPYFQDGDSPTPQHTPVLQEAAADEGAMIWSDGTNWVLDNMLHGFTLPSWTNPVPIASHIATNGNFTLDTLQDGQSCYYDWLTNPSSPIQTIDYQYRRFSVNGEEGVLYFPDGFVITGSPNCGTQASPVREIDLFIGCRSTVGNLHATPIRPDQVPTQDCTNLSGPDLPVFAIPVFEQSLPYRATADRYAIVAVGGGGGGNHPLWQMMQHNLTILKYVENVLANDVGYCFDVVNVYIVGSSFGGSVALLQSMLYPEIFDGAIAFGAAGVGPEGFYGLDRLMRAGLFVSNYGSELQVPGSNTWVEDAWYLHQMQKLIEYSASMGTKTGALMNFSVLGRLEDRKSQSQNLFYRPFIMYGADEDAVTLAPVTRFRFEDVLDTSIGATSEKYSDYARLLPYAFMEHGGVLGEAIALFLHPKTYFPNSDAPTNGNVVDWLKALHATWESSPNNTWVASPPEDFDDGLPALTQASDYPFASAAITSPPDTASGTLALTQMWTAAPPNGNGKGFIGTGIETGLNHNLTVQDIDDDEYLEVIYGEGSGFVHIWQWNPSAGTSGELEFDYRSPDMGTAVTGLDVGTFAKPGGGTMTGLMALSASGELWGIWYDSTTSSYQSKSFTGPLVYAGEREIPQLAIGEHAEGSTTVYIVGTGTAHAGGTNEPNACRLQRLDVTDITQAQFSVGAAEDFEPATELYWDSGASELVSASARGYLMRIQESSGNFHFPTTVGNYGLGDYLKMTPCQIEKVTLSSQTVYLAVGVPGDTKDFQSATDVERNLIAVGANGQILEDGSQVQLRELLPASVNSSSAPYLPLDCFTVLENDGSQVRLAAGGADGLHLLDFDLTSGFSDEVANWSPQRWLKTGDTQAQLNNSPIISLQSQTVGEDLLLFGTTVHGIIFVAEVPTGFPTQQAAPTLLYIEEPQCLATGIKVFPESFSSLGQATNDLGCDVDLKPTLNLVSDFTYHDAFADSFAFDFKKRGPAGSYFTRADALTGIIDQLRPKNVICRDFNPDDRAAVLTGLGGDTANVWNCFWTNTPNTVQLDKHVFDETGDVGQLVQAGQWDLALIGDQTFGPNAGQLLTITDYLSGPTPTQYPSLIGNTFMLDDRFFVGSSPRAFGGKVCTANLDNSNGNGIVEVVLSTNGGRLVTLKEGASPSVWTSWTDTDPSADPTGDFGWNLSGLAAYNITPNSMPPDKLDEVFAVGAIYTDSTDPTENDSHLMIFESNGSGALTRVFNGDLGEAGCTGLWVGPALAKCACQGEINVIVGRAQTFGVYKVNRAAKTVDLANPIYVSPGLGSGIGAASSIKVLRGQTDPDDEEKKVDYIFIGSDAYFYAFRTPGYSAIGGPH